MLADQSRPVGDAGSADRREMLLLSLRGRFCDDIDHGLRASRRCRSPLHPWLHPVAPSERGFFQGYAARVAVKRARRWCEKVVGSVTVGIERILPCAASRLLFMHSPFTLDEVRIALRACSSYPVRPRLWRYSLQRECLADHGPP